MTVVSAAALAEEVRQRAPSAPQDRIDAALAVSEELTAAADELIGRFVAEARAAGCSWTEIGQRMGVSKQAARQRFAPWAPVGPASGYASSLERRPRLLACLEAARREASAEGAAEVGTQHQLLGLFEAGVAAAILERLGLRVETVRQAVRELVPLEEAPNGGPPAESDEALHALHGAAALAERAGRDYVATEHLLAVLTLDPGSRARRVLNHLGVSIPAIKRELECYLGPGKQRRRRRGRAAAGRCSFCGKPGVGGLRLIAGPGVHICAECVGLCTEILAEERGRPGASGGVG